ncbi:hypothetical protein PG997_000809 [Apiospora hydei]|uniref:F-box domain-containing protein n=1 Tax=Apiospora hydei TaxID=1337664 RepID=A0ABR1XBX1_9PEZI
MEQTLAQALGGLKLADGQIDHHAREANLSYLVQGGSLTTNEIRLLRGLLSQFTFQTDILSKLPVELVIAVVRHLQLRDIWSCLTVSKTWRSRLMSQDISRALSDVHFPAISYTWGESARRGTGAAKSISSLFIQAVRASLRCNKTPFRSELVNKFSWKYERYFSINPEEYDRYPKPSNDSGLACDSLYAYGRIAWAYESHTFVIDCLNTWKRRIYSSPSSKLFTPVMQLEALGSKLLVASVLKRTFFAWDIETGRLEQVKLPSWVQTCTTEGDRVAFVTRDKQLYVWKYGASLLSVDVTSISPPLDDAKATPVAIAHPNDEDTIFMATRRASSDKATTLVVYEFNKLRFVRSYEGQLPDDINLQSTTSGFGEKEVHYWADFEKTNSYGLYALCHTDVGRQKHPDQHAGRICTTQFDIYHKQFVEQRFELPMFYPKTKHRVWNNCLVFGGMKWLDDGEITVVVHQPGLEQHRPASRRGIPWLDTEAEPDFEHFDPHPRAIIHDDNFMIALFYNGYVVWRLDSRPSRPKAAAPQLS